MERLCFFNTAKAWGGGEKWHFEISSYLHKKGHNVFVVAHSQSALYQRLLKAGIPCEGIKLTNLSFLNPFKHLRIKTLLKKNNVRAIIMNLSRDVKIAGPSAKKANVSRIIYRRGSAIPIKNSFLNRFLFKNIVSEVLANSVATKKTVLQKNPSLFPEEKIQVIYNGIDIVHPSKIDHLVTKKEFVLVSLGRLEYEKNHQFLVHLARELNKRGLIFKVIIGGDGRLKEHLENLIKKYKVEEQVYLSGFIEDSISFLQQADVFVLPSLWEGFGYVLAEAALCKKAIVAFNVGSIPEIVTNEKMGYLVPEGDIQSFADKIIDLYENEDKRLKMGLAGHDKVKREFNKKIQLQKIEDYLING